MVRITRTMILKWDPYSYKTRKNVSMPLTDARVITFINTVGLMSLTGTETSLLKKQAQ